MVSKHNREVGDNYCPLYYLIMSNAKCQLPVANCPLPTAIEYGQPPCGLSRVRSPKQIKADRRKQMPDSARRRNMQPAHIPPARSPPTPAGHLKPPFPQFCIGFAIFC